MPGLEYKVKKKLKQNGIAFTYIPTGEPTQNSDFPAVANNWYQNDIHNTLLKADIAFIWPPKYVHGLEATARPATRLLTWFANGIPTIFYPLQSYLDVCNSRANPTSCLSNIARTPDELIDKLITLAQSPRLMKQQCLAGLEISEQYSAQMSAKLLVSLLNSFLANPPQAYSSSELEAVLYKTAHTREKNIPASSRQFVFDRVFLFAEKLFYGLLDVIS